MIQCPGMVRGIFTPKNPATGQAAQPQKGRQMMSSKTKQQIFDLWNANMKSRTGRTLSGTASDYSEIAYMYWAYLLSQP